MANRRRKSGEEGKTEISELLRSGWMGWNTEVVNKNSISYFKIINKVLVNQYRQCYYDKKHISHILHGISAI